LFRDFAETRRGTQYKARTSKPQARNSRPGDAAMHSLFKKREIRIKLSAMRIDPALSEQGDWIENSPDLPGIRIKARGTNNSDYRALEAKLVREIPRAERIEGASPKEQDRIACQLLLQTVVLDVAGLEQGFVVCRHA
jgi:hypothetical protein